jgi:uncharacterized membrane protein
MSDHNDHSSETGDSGEIPQLIVTVRVGLLARVRTYFLTGIIVTAPIGITVYIAWQFITWVDESIRPLFPPAYNPETYVPFALPGLGLVVGFVVLTLVGALTASFFGRSLMRVGERLVERMPVVRTIYSALKQIFETVLAQSSDSFSEVVLVEYPRRELWTIAFVTSQTKGEVQSITEDEMVNIYVPTTPNPTSGFLLFVPRKDLRPLSMTVEEGIKYVISTGIIVPPDRRTDEQLALPLITGIDRN